MALTGLDRLARDRGGLLKGCRVGLLAHGASVDSRLVHAAESIDSLPGVTLASIFSPEHGLYGAAQDMESVGRALDRRTGLPVTSLYGPTFESLKPPPGSMEGLDVLVVDLQDVGARYYTFIYTMLFCLEAAAEAGVRVLVTDRPNPIGGTAVEGNLPREGFESFVGLHPLAVRHGMTVGELSLMFREERGIDVELETVRMEGWRREMYFEETGLPWAMPSPNMPTPDTALVYPGMCLVEGTKLSEGRGATRPFELAGAPFVDGHVLSEVLKKENLPGVGFRPVYFKPTFQKWAGVTCGGVQLHVVNRRIFKSFLTGIAFLKAIANLWPGEFEWRTEPYEFVSDIPAIDLLSGNDLLRRQIEENLPLPEIEAAWREEEESFRERRERFLLYR